MSTATRRKPESAAQDATQASPTIPELRNGDRLTAEEFMRRYEAMPGVRAELVEGVVYVSSPVSIDHGGPHFGLNGALFVYEAMTPGVAGATDATVRLDLDNCPQPDLHLRILGQYGGRTRISPDRYVVGAPELVGEVAVSTASYDLHDKLNAYRRNGVLEYVVWRVQEQAIDWFLLREGRFVRIAASPSGVFQSVTFPGLWLDGPALIRGDSASVLATLQLGLASPEHAAFVAQLAAEAARLSAPPAPPQEPRP